MKSAASTVFSAARVPSDALDREAVTARKASCPASSGGGVSVPGALGFTRG